MSAVANPARHYKPTQAKSKYRPEIDGLRAFAVVAVIINHFNKDLLPSGYLGVDIFFVISGYVITSSLAGRESKNFLDFLTGFYERRIKRLVPALVVFVLITSVLISLFNPDPGVALGLGRKSLFGVSNISLYRSSTDYFAQSTELNPFTQTWSLGVEEQFYLLFPFLIWFSGFGQQTAKGARNLFFWVGAMTIASLIGFIYLYQVNQPAAYFLMPTRFWEMAAGCLLFIGFQKRAKIEQALEQVPPLLVVAAMVGVMYLPVAAAVPATIGIVVLSAVLIACLKRGTAAYDFFTLEKVVYVGLISYSLYLWHWSVLSISRWTIGIHWWSVPIQVGLMMLLAIGSYRLAEQPVRRCVISPSRWKILSLGLAALTFTFATARLINKTSVNILLGSTRDGKVIFSENTNWMHKRCQNFRIYDFLPSASILEQCWIGGEGMGRSPNRKLKRVFTYGDSYNEQLVPAYSWIARENPGKAFHAYYSSGCTASKQLTFTDEKIRGHCSRVLKRYLEWFNANSRKGDTLIIAVSPRYFYSTPKPKYNFLIGKQQISVDMAVEKYISELQEIAIELNSRGIGLVVTSGIPVLKYNPDLCSQWYAAINNECGGGKIFDTVQTSDVERINAKISAGIKNYAVWVNLFESFQQFPKPVIAYRNYYNRNHLSRVGALKVKKLVSSAITESDPIWGGLVYAAH